MITWSRASLAIRSKEIGLREMTTLLGEGSWQTDKDSPAIRGGKVMSPRGE